MSCVNPDEAKEYSQIVEKGAMQLMWDIQSGTAEDPPAAFRAYIVKAFDTMKKVFPEIVEETTLEKVLGTIEDHSVCALTEAQAPTPPAMFRASVNPWHQGPAAPAAEEIRELSPELVPLVENYLGHMSEAHQAAGAAIWDLKQLFSEIPDF